MRYQATCLESFGYTLPDEIITSDQIEAQLAPLYERLRLPAGRLELITGVRERRLWPTGTAPSDISVQSAEAAIQAADIDRSEIGALIHGSVCRDYLEPATACSVHHRLGLPAECQIFDLSNACLGLLNGMVQVANMIELGQIRAGLVVGTEDSRPLLETTIAQLNREQSLTRKRIKTAIASLTIGSASCAVLLTSDEISKSKNRLLGSVTRANTQHHGLCHSGQDEAAVGGMQPLMETDSEALMREGIATGARTFDDLLDALQWNRDDLHKTFIHQVGTAHRKAMFEAMELDTAIDFSTVEWLGNTGSVALPISMARGIEAGHLSPGDQVGMLGIGSGINSLMLGVSWQESAIVQSSAMSAAPAATCQD